MGDLARLVAAREAMVARACDDAALRSFAEHADVTIGIAGGEHALALRVHPGGIDDADPSTADAVMLAPEEAWDGCLAARPAPTLHHFLAMRMRVPGARVVVGPQLDSSDQPSTPEAELAFAQHAHVARRIVELARATLHGEPELPAAPAIDRSGIRGRHVPVTVEGSTIDLHVEEAGDAALPSILVLHTAGADARQGHPIMADRRVTDRYRVVAFDLPGHGASERLPHPFGAWTLTTQRYTDVILAVIDALSLESPILLGASMAGEVCLAMAHRAPERLGGIIACEASEHVPGRVTPWPRDPRVNAMAFTAEWIDGLIGPWSPARQREEIRWQYAQGGLGIFPGDIDFYSAPSADAPGRAGAWDGREIVADIDTSACPVVMMTGEYDYSCTPAMSEATAARIPGAVFWTMPGLGHFPICEHPEAFAPHLQRALAVIEGGTNA